jgi:hypothetical protein
VVVMGGGGSVRPIGISPQVNKLKPNETWWRGDQWPPAGYVAEIKEGAQPTAQQAQEAALSPTEVANNWSITAQREFPRRAWAPQYFSIVLLEEFVKAKAPSPNAGEPDYDWTTIELEAPPQDAELEAELDELVALSEYREGVLGEALAQCGDIANYWRGVLSFTPATHPATNDLLFAALRIAELSAMRHKRKHDRIRPSQICPALMPPIDPPGHAAYPSGHATEAFLVAEILIAVTPPAAHDALKRMAQRIARNREVIGMHYPSDSVAGRKLAALTAELMMKCPTIAELAQQARVEWGL